MAFAVTAAHARMLGRKRDAPVADGPVPQVAPDVQSTGALPLAANAQAFGVGVGQSLEQGGDVATRLHYDAVQQFNTVQVMNAHNALQDFNQSALFDPKTGLLNQNTGAQAPGASAKVLSDHDAAVSKISDGLANDAQKIQFQRLADENRRTIQAHLDGYETKQVNSYADGVAQATVKNSATAASQNAILAASDPTATTPAARAAGINTAAAQSIEMGTAAITDNFRRQYPTAGPSDPRLQEQVQAYQSAAHYGVVSALLAQDKDQDAKAYYDANKGALQGAQRDDAALKVEAGSTAGEAVRRANALVYDKDGKPRDLDAILTDIHGDEQLQANPKLLDQTTARAMRLVSQADDAKREGDKADFKSAYDLMQAQGFSSPAVQAKIATMTPERQEQLRSYDRRQTRGEPPDPRVSAQTEYQMRKLAAENPEAFKKVDLLPKMASGELTPGAFGTLSNQQLEMQNAGPTRPKPSLVDPVADKYLTDVGMDPAVTFKKDPVAFKKVGAFRDLLNQELDARQAAQGGKPLQPKDIREALASVTQPVAEHSGREALSPSTWWGGRDQNKPFYQHVQDLEASFPPGTKDQAYAAFNAKNKRDPSPSEYANLLEARARQGNR